jgi:hypothetical protein
MSSGSAGLIKDKEYTDAAKEAAIGTATNNAQEMVNNLTGVDIHVDTSVDSPLISTAIETLNDKTGTDIDFDNNRELKIANLKGDNILLGDTLPAVSGTIKAKIDSVDSKTGSDILFDSNPLPEKQKKIADIKGTNIQIGSGNAESGSIKEYIDNSHPVAEMYDYKSIGEMLDGSSIRALGDTEYEIGLNTAAFPNGTAANSKVLVEVFEYAILKNIIKYYLNSDIATQISFSIRWQIRSYWGGNIQQFEFYNGGDGTYKITYRLQTTYPNFFVEYTVSEATDSGACRYIIPNNTVLATNTYYQIGFTKSSLETYLLLNPSLQDSDYAEDMYLRFCITLLRGIVIRRKIIYDLERRK